MDLAIRHHFQQDIMERIKLTGGYTFQTWLLILSNNQKVIFRTRSDFITGGGRKIIIADVLKREKFFYDTVNKEVGHICPEVYVIDDSCKYYHNPYQISEYMEGTPLNLCFDDFDIETKNRILYKIGVISAKIGKIEIYKGHPYVASRNSWEEFIADRLYERLLPLIKNNVITLFEIKKITNALRNKRAEKTLSFLHLDMRFINMVYNNGNVYILDAENCEFGDPLFELAVIDISNNLTDSFLDGYKSILGKSVDLNNDLFYYYKMERLALVLDVFMNEVLNDTEYTRYYLTKFNGLKDRLLKTHE